jgi:hypothetical protein
MNTTTDTRKTITRVIPDHELRHFQRAIAVAGGRIINSGPTAGGYTVTYVL